MALDPEADNSESRHQDGSRYEGRGGATTRSHVVRSLPARSRGSAAMKAQPDQKGKQIFLEGLDPLNRSLRIESAA